MRSAVSAFLTTCYLDWLERQDRPWFAHLSYLRPHPPYAAAGRWAVAFDPDKVDMPIAPSPHRHRLHEAALGLAETAAPTDEGALRSMRAQYYGMIGDVDAQLGRVWDALERLGQWEDTFVLVTSDHGDQLGDHGLTNKLGFFEESYRVPGIVRAPGPGAARGRRAWLPPHRYGPAAGSLWHADRCPAAAPPARLPWDGRAWVCARAQWISAALWARI